MSSGPDIFWHLYDPENPPEQKKVMWVQMQCGVVVTGRFSGLGWIVDNYALRDCTCEYPWYWAEITYPEPFGA